MIKVIAFDLVGVLVRENDYKLDAVDSKIERLFGPNLSDNQFAFEVLKIDNSLTEEKIIDRCKNIINSIYDMKYSLNDLLELKKLYPNIQFVVATNHISIIKEFIDTKFKNIWDKVYISSEINHIKPNADFYNYILDDLNISPNEMLFLDDSITNIEGANNLYINTIHVTRDMNIIEEIKKII